jgi:predicted AAA+ superfamily ATPase
VVEKNLIKSVVCDQQSESLPADYVNRAVEDKLARLFEDPSVLIITGLRRCGKSVMLQWLRYRAEEKDYYVNFDDDRFAAFTIDDFQQLYEVLLEMYGPQSTFYFDEIQNVDGWERFVRRLHNEGKKVVITGSNAKMLSRELGTHLTGRNLVVEMYPYSFKEFLQSQKSLIKKNQFQSTQGKAELLAAFKKYQLMGGIPDYVKNKNPEYLKSLYDNILYRDIIVRNKVASEKVIKQLCHYLASNISKDTSFNKLKNMLNVKGSNTVSEYCQYIEDAYLCFLVNRFAPSLKSQVGYTKKSYFVDTAMAQLVGFRMSKDEGQLLENVVFLELKRRDKEVYFYHEEVGCDFLIKEQHEITQAIQVSVSLSEEKTKLRELKGLVAAMKQHQIKEGVIITTEESEELNYEGCRIKILPAYQWLLL